MNGTYQDGRLRLVSLVSTLASISKPMLGLDQILDLAKKGDVRLYVRLPADKVAYVDELLPIVVHRRSSMYVRDMGDFTRYSPLSHQIHPEVTHVALDPDQAEELKTKRRTEDMAFGSGLSLHPNGTLAEAEWWVPCQFGASLVICPVPPESEDEKKRQRVRRNVLRNTPEDVYVDEYVLTLLQDPLATNREDPFLLRRRAPGVYVLYCAARDYYAALKAKKISFKKVQDRIVSQLRELRETDAKHAAKLINPYHKRNSGVEKEDQKTFDADILNDAEFIKKYRRSDFINDALALVLYVTNLKMDALVRSKSVEAKKHQAYKDAKRKKVQANKDAKENKLLASWDVEKIRRQAHKDAEAEMLQAHNEAVSNKPLSNEDIVKHFCDLGFYQKERNALALLVLLTRS
jgi:hypothetical protein